MAAEPTLRQRVALGGAWVLALRAVEQGVRLVRLLLVARLIAPEQFGLMGIALLGLATLQTFTDSGFHVALVRKRGEIERDLDTAWSIGLLRGALLFAALAGAAPWIARFFEAPAATDIVRAVGVSFLLQALSNPAVVRFQRELRFDRQFAVQFAGTLTDGVVAVSAAVALRSAWALVFGLLAGDLVRLVAGYLLAPRRPRFEIDRARALELWGFGKWLLGSSILVFISTQGDDVFVGKVLGPTMLAFYQLAFRISNLPATEFSRLVASVALPAFAEVQDQPDRLRRGYLEALQLTAMFAAPVAALILVLAPEFTALVLGQAWLPAVPAMQILAVCGLSRAIAAPGPLFLALGRPALRTRLQLIGVAVLVLTLVPLTLLWGITGAALAATARAVVMKLVAVFWALRLTGLPKARGTGAVLPALWSATLAGLVAAAWKTYLLPPTNLGALLLTALVGGAVYLAIGWVTDRWFGLGGETLLRRQLAALRRRSG